MLTSLFSVYFLSILITQANTHTVPVTDPEILAAVGNVEVNSSNVDIDSLNKHHHPPGRKERCFFSGSSSHVPSSSPVQSWDIIPRIQTQNGGYSQEPAGRYSNPISPNRPRPYRYGSYI